MSQKRPREEIQPCSTTISQSCLDTMYIEKHRQKDALAICDMSPGAMVFALDLKKGAGAKTFVVAGFKAFWSRYSRASARRCHYEVIRPGMPCKFYMDIDVDFAEVPETFDGQHIVSELRRIVALHFELLLGIEQQDPHVRVVELDSTNDKKFSRHIIWDLGAGRAFASNADCGAFYRHIERYIIEHFGPPEQNRFWFTKNSKDAKVPTPMADATVYTTNRNFRLYRSSKLGQERYLNRFDNETRTVAPSIGSDALYASDREYLLQSMIQYFSRPPSIILRVNEPIGVPAIYTSSTWYAMHKKNQLYERGTLSIATEAREHLNKIETKTRSGPRQSGRLCYNSLSPDPDLISKSDSWSTAQIPLVVYECCLATHERLADELAGAGKLQYYNWYPESLSCVCQFVGLYCAISQRTHSSNHAKLSFSFRGSTPRYKHSCNSASCKDSSYKPVPTEILTTEFSARLKEMRTSYNESMVCDFRETFGCLFSVSTTESR